MYGDVECILEQNKKKKKGNNAQRNDENLDDPDPIIPNEVSIYIYIYKIYLN